MTWIVFFLLQTVACEQLDIEKEKSKACSSRVTAATDSLRGDGTVNLFVDDRVFVFDPKAKAIVDVFDLIEDFPGIETPIGAAAAAKRKYIYYDFYLLSKDQMIYSYVNSTNGRMPQPLDKGNQTLREFDTANGVTEEHHTPDCMAALCEGINTCHYWRIFNNWSFRELYCKRVKSTKDVAPNCKMHPSEITTPKNMDADLINGLKQPCEAMAITYDDNKGNETALTYIDGTNLHYFVNHEELYSMPLDNVFGCTNFMKNPFFLALVIGAPIIATCAVVVFIVVVTVRSKSHDTDGITVQSTSQTCVKDRQR